MGLYKISVLTAPITTETIVKSHAVSQNWNEQFTGVTLPLTSAWAISAYPGYGYYVSFDVETKYYCHNVTDSIYSNIFTNIT